MECGWIRVPDGYDDLPSVVVGWRAMTNSIENQPFSSWYFVPDLHFMFRNVKTQRTQISTSKLRKS